MKIKAKSRYGTAERTEKKLKIEKKRKYIATQIKLQIRFKAKMQMK